jgi:hypothetical protein
MIGGDLVTKRVQSIEVRFVNGPDDKATDWHYTFKDSATGDLTNYVYSTEDPVPPDGTDMMTAVKAAISGTDLPDELPV